MLETYTMNIGITNKLQRFINCCLLTMEKLKCYNKIVNVELMEIAK